MTIESTLERIATALETLAAAPRIVEVTDAPKATRRRSAPTDAAVKEPAAPAVEKSTATSESETVATADTATDDLFGEETAPVVEEKKAPKLTIENVKAALVEVQTKLKHKDHALALLAKHTVPKGTKVLSGLPESAYAALIAEAAASIKAGKVS